MMNKNFNFNPLYDRNLLVLGNGFDLDIGLPTSYKQFAESDYFPFVIGDESIHSLGRYVMNAVGINKWYDLENILAKYGVLYTSEVEGDKEDFIKLTDALKRYLKAIDKTHLRKNSVAARLVSAVKDNLSPPLLYSFNYTSLSEVGYRLGFGNPVEMHVHGSLSNDDIIFGVGDYVELGPSTDYLYKTSNEKYRSTDLLRYLDLFENVFIFGLSLSQVDYPYFEDFFNKVANGQYGNDQKKYIRIFTYDEESRMDILRNLRQMNRGRMIPISNYADFDIIRTKNDIDEIKVERVLEHIEKPLIQYETK